MRTQHLNITLSRIVAVILILVPATASATTADLLKASNEIHTYMSNPTALTAANCATSLANIVKTVEAFNSKDLDRKNLKTAAAAIIQNFWDTRVLLRKKMIEFHKSGTLSPACVSGIRNTFSALRFMEEYAGVHTLKAGAWVDPKPRQVFSSGFPSMVTDPNHKDFKFKTGDILVSYGMAYGSAAISHVGEDGGTFSHLAMVYVKGADVYTIEAHPEFGVKVALLDKYLKDGKGRSALFRHPDTELAATAGKAIYEVAYKPDSLGHPIPYDFTMNLTDHTTLFCTETASYAFEMADKILNRTTPIPMFPTVISLKNPYITDAFEIKGRIAFAPSDMEVDPQFEMIAEWRDLGRARLMHHQQAALKMQFKWLDNLNYAYKSDLAKVLLENMLFTGRKLPLFSGLLENMIPPNISQKALKAVVNVYVTSDLILEQLIERDEKLESKSRGTLMTSKEILANLEDARQADLESYRMYQMERLYPTNPETLQGMPTSQFHWHLRPRGEP